MNSKSRAAAVQEERSLEGKHVVLGITGSIAAYKGADLASKLTQEGASVDVVMTRESREFVTTLTFASLTGRVVISDMFDISGGPRISHVELGNRADIVVIAPATANVIAKLAAGIADDELTCVVLASEAPLLIAPAMHAAMYRNKATRENIAKLKARGVTFVGPAEGRLASGGYGAGRFVDASEVIGAVHLVLGRSGDLAGRHVVVTAGGTQEPIDPVRHITNRSSGKMGYAIAVAARDRGAEVTLVSGPVALPKPYGVKVVAVNTAVEMLEAVSRATERADALIMAAAVGDYRVAHASTHKIKKGQGALALELTPNPDILKRVNGKFIKVGFAAESEDLVLNARKKLKEKSLDLIVANDITAADSGFGSDQNRVSIIDKLGKVEDLPLQLKSAVANRILDRVVALFPRK